MHFTKNHIIFFSEHLGLIQVISENLFIFTFYTTMNDTHSDNTMHSPNVVLMLARRLWRWVDAPCSLHTSDIPDNIPRGSCHPENTRHWSNSGSMLAQLHRRWPNIDNIASKSCVCWTRTDHAPNAGLMLGHRLRRWHNIKPALD